MRRRFFLVLITILMVFSMVLCSCDRENTEYNVTLDNRSQSKVWIALHNSTNDYTITILPAGGTGVLNSVSEGYFSMFIGKVDPQGRRLAPSVWYKGCYLCRDAILIIRHDSVCFRH